MKLYLQMGHGMQAMAEELIKDWGSGNIILSPVNIAQKYLLPFVNRIANAGGRVLFDPQMFCHREANENLKEYTYWPEDGVSITTDTNHFTFRELLKINKDINSKYIILPGVEMNANDVEYGLKWARDGVQYFTAKTDKPVLATLCLSSDILRNASAIETFVEALRGIPADGFYVVPQPYKNQYLVTDHMWMIGLLKLLTCLKLAKKTVIVGYSNHQGLIYALANVDGIASGSFMNTRSYNPGRFKARTGDDFRRRSNWYYLPSAFSEYQIPMLDVAQYNQILDRFKPKKEFENKYSAMLFAGAQPTSTNYRERNSFRHYLHCLRLQCEILTKPTYLETFDLYDFMLSSADAQIKEFKKFGMTGSSRDFAPALETNQVSMLTNERDYGFKLRMDWEK